MESEMRVVDKPHGAAVGAEPDQDAHGEKERSDQDLDECGPFAPVERPARHRRTRP